MSGTFMLAATAAGETGQTFNIPDDGKTTFQASGATTAGAGAASVIVWVSNDGDNWISAGTISLTLGTTVTTDGFAFDARWEHVRAELDSVSGTGAYVNVFGSGIGSD